MMDVVSDGVHRPEFHRTWTFLSAICKRVRGTRVFILESFSKYWTCHFCTACLKCDIGLEDKVAKMSVRRRSLCVVVLSSAAVMRCRVSLMNVMYLETSSLNWDKVTWWMFYFADSTKATLFRCMWWQVDHRISGPSLHKEGYNHVVMGTANSSVKDESSRQAKHLAL